MLSSDAMFVTERRNVGVCHSNVTRFSLHYYFSSFDHSVVFYTIVEQCFIVIIITQFHNILITHAVGLCFKFWAAHFLWIAPRFICFGMSIFSWFIYLLQT